MTELEIYSKNLNDAYNSNGFVLIKNAYETDIQKLRADVLDIFNNRPYFPDDIRQHPTLGDIRSDLFGRYPEIWPRLLSPNLIGHLKLLLGQDFILTPNAGMHRNGFGSWHKDTGSQERAGHTFHHEPGYGLVTVAFYLQPNTPEYGGGIEVLPGSHHVRFKWYRDDIKGYVVPSDAGDAVIFNHLLDHKASWPDAPRLGGPEKLAIFFSASRNNEVSRRFYAYLKTRPEEAYKELTNKPYRPEMIEFAKQHEILLA